MLLTYASNGTRSFGFRPVKPYARAVWEFYAVLKGKIAPSFAAESAPLTADTLWLFPPNQIHGWWGQKRQSARVAVFHFRSVPPALAELCQSREYFQKSITHREKKILAQTAKESALEVLGQGPLFEFYSQRVLMDLALIALRQTSVTADEPLHSAQARVEAALGWYRSMLPTRPSLEQMACASGLTEGHLRRLFQATHHCSPRAMMHKIQLEMASAQLTATDTKLEAVANDCGFAGAGELCRAFKKEFGITPAEFRKRACASD